MMTNYYLYIIVLIANYNLKAKEKNISNIVIYKLSDY